MPSQPYTHLLPGRKCRRITENRRPKTTNVFPAVSVKRFLNKGRKLQ
ncbi:hypothetical protein M5D96_002947 [Drosophila gunungcola]|uniref:Uncharacterized protein n=1 Tax=Drosophila gunungcola TaxID=103775 RepID=A0A9P9Z101_9MUSC|nr:hypothetical protein M5D96_002947 [Drosophila gunungcola]